MSKISDQLKDRMSMKHGISSDDIAELVEEANTAEPGPEPAVADAVDLTSTVEKESPESHDPVMAHAGSDSDTRSFFLGLVNAPPDSGAVEITPEDKRSFIDAILTNGRMKIRYSLFGGKLSFVVKNRTYDEARAALSAASRKEFGGDDLQISFAMRIRLMLMAMQIDELNGVSYPDADSLGPLLPVVGVNGLEKPKWLARIEVLGKLPEAMFEAIWQCIYEFESKYWTLVRHSRDQDFWLPG